MYLSATGEETVLISMIRRDAAMPCKLAGRWTAHWSYGRRILRQIEAP